MYSIIYIRCIFFLKTMYFRVGQLPKSVTKSSWSALGLVSSPKINCPTRICELVSSQNCAAQLELVSPRFGQLAKLFCPTRICQLVSSQNGVAQLVFWSWSVSIQNCAAQLVFSSWSALDLISKNCPAQVSPTRVLELVSTQNCAAQLVFSSWSTLDLISSPNCPDQLVFSSWSAPIIALPNSCFRVGQLPKLPCPSAPKTLPCPTRILRVGQLPKLPYPTHVFELVSSVNCALTNSKSR